MSFWENRLPNAMSLVVGKTLHARKLKGKHRGKNREHYIYQKQQERNGVRAVCRYWCTSGMQLFHAKFQGGRSM